MKKDYRMSEQLFIDVWESYGRPDELFDKNKINMLLKDLVEKSGGLIVLDHYSLINFDRIERIEVDGQYTNIIWRDLSKYHKRMMNGELSEHDEIEWFAFGYTTLEYLMMDIFQAKFVLKKNHLFLLIQSNYIQQRKAKKIIESKGEIFKTIEWTERMYTDYWYWSGPSEEKRKHCCIVSLLPYYTCVIQPKENIPNTNTSKKIMLWEI